MYFDDINLFPIEQYVDNLDNLYAHTKSGDKEKLKAHLDLAYKYFIDICAAKNLDNVFNNLLYAYRIQSSEAETLWKELLCNTIYMHDIGKLNSGFQSEKMGNTHYRNVEAVNSKHSMLSACIYFDYNYKKVQELQEEARKPLLLVFLFLNSFIISKHHGSLSDFYEFGESFIDEYCTYKCKEISFKDYKNKLIFSERSLKRLYTIAKETLKTYENKEAWKGIDFYIYVKLVFSLLIASDFYATSHYQNNCEIKNYGIINDVNKYYKVFKENPIYKSIQSYLYYLEGKGKNPYESGDINELRTQMFIEADNRYSNNLRENIFYLEAPTGSGKTNTSINLAFKTIEMDNNINKIFYIFPFNTLVEQTKNSLNDIFQNNIELVSDISVINSITPITTVDIDEDNNSVKDQSSGSNIDYEKSLLNRQFLNYPIVLTTHINLFNYFFGTSREEGFPLLQLANSVIILDEIQSYRNSIWKEIITFLNKYSKLLNIKIIIMSATLPELDKLIDWEVNTIKLIEDRNKFFNNPIFKDRVKLDFSMLELRENVEEALLEKVKEAANKAGTNILVEFIKKARATDFYKRLIEIKDVLGKDILLITGDDNKAERKRIINRVKNEKDIVLVATQVIEAGVDIDMDIGFKDISLLDAEEQFLGRINRSCKKKDCIVYFFKLDEAKQIYKGDFRKNKDVTLISPLIREVLKNKKFGDYYDLVMNKLRNSLGEENDNNIDYFREEIVAKLNFVKIKKRLELIEEVKEYTLFINTSIVLETGETLKGSEVWQEYYTLLKDASMSYAEKRVKLSQVSEKMDYFTYKINRFLSSYSDNIGDIFYIEDGEKYFTEGKFDRSKVNEGDKFEFIGC